MALYRNGVSNNEGIPLLIKPTHKIVTNYVNPGGYHIVVTYLPTGEVTESRNTVFHNLIISFINSSPYYYTFSLEDGTYYVKGTSAGAVSGYYLTETQSAANYGTWYFACNLKIKQIPSFVIE